MWENTETNTLLSVNMEDSPLSTNGSEETDIKPAWVDEDDEVQVGKALWHQNKRKLPSGGLNDGSNSYSKLLKHKFSSVVGNPSWASLKPSQTDPNDEDLQKCGFIKTTVQASLPSNTLEFKKVKDLNLETYSEGIINSIEFHPLSSAALVAGNKGIASLFAVDGKRNAKLHSIAFENFPIFAVKFLNDGNEALFGSRRSHVFSYDMMAAKATRILLPPGLTQCKRFIVSPDSKLIAVASKWGEIHLLLSSSKERIAILKQDNEVTALNFSPDGNTLYGHSNNFEVNMWDMNTRRIKHKWTDDGCIQGTALEISPSNQFLATGSAQGVVNLYKVEDVCKDKFPKPMKTVLNLTTEINHVRFNPTSEILSFASSAIQNSVRLLHTGSCTIFNNFPPFGSKLDQVTAFNYSTRSGYLAIGNKKSVVSLYRLKHYKNY